MTDRSCDPVPALEPKVFTSPSGRIVLTIKPWRDHDNAQIVRELADIIEALQEMHRICDRPLTEIGEPDE